MAPIPPQAQSEIDLSKCFAGDVQLISWDLTYNALCDPETAAKSAPLRAFLTAEASLEILSKPWKPFAEPSAQEKTKFETATAPINLPGAQNSRHLIEEVKADSLWLSQQARISEYSALRLAIIEWQSRPTIQLLSGLTEEEALSVQEAAGISNLGASTFAPGSSILTLPSDLVLQSDTNFDSADQRKLRLFDLYLSTRIAILRVSQLLIAWGSARELRQCYGPEYRIGDDWLEQLGQAIAAKQQRKDPSSPTVTFLDQCVRTLNTTLDALDDGFAWTMPDSILEVALEKWATAQLTEVVQVLHIALIHADLLTKKFIQSSTLEEWFNSMSKRNFFADPPILLSSLFSLAILKVDIVLQDLETGEYDSWDTSAYVLNPHLIEMITIIFGYTKQLGPSPATPPAFAWSILTWRLFQEAKTLEESRDRPIESNSRISATTASSLEDAVMALTRLESGELFDKRQPYQDIGESCLNFEVFGIITTLTNVAISTFGTTIDQISRDSSRILFLQLIRAALSTGIIRYSTEVILSAYAIIAGDRSFRMWTSNVISRHPDPVVSIFLNDDTILRPELLEQSHYRYPYEIGPLLQFCSALTRGEKSSHDGMPAVGSILANTMTLMQRLPENFSGYASIREEENANFVALSEPLPQFASVKASLFGGPRRRLLTASASYDDSDIVMVIPPGTEGNIVDDSSQPFVSVWRYPHSALEYFVQLLTTYTVGSSQVEYATQQPISISSAADIIGLFADLLHSSLRASTDNDSNPICSTELLAALDIRIDRNQDTVDIILSIFEEELLRLCQQPGNEESLDLLVNCIQFLRALVVIAPNRVWPWLIRSRLLEREGSGGSMATILIGTEMVLGRYDFLIGCIQLFRTLIKDAVGRTVARKSASKALTRFNAATTSDSGTSDKIMSDILLTFGRTLASIHEGSLTWKFVRQEDRLEINIGICSVFNMILELAYGVDDAPKLSAKLTGVIAPIAEYITGLYISKSLNDLPTNPILASLLAGTEQDCGYVLTGAVTLWRQQTLTALSFSNTIVRVAVLLDKPWTHLEQRLFKATPLLTRLYSMSDAYKSSVVLLLETLVRGAVRVAEQADKEKETGVEKKEPPSLLGHLGPRTAKNFLSILSQLDEPLKIVDIQTSAWNLLSAVVTCKQQWFALYLLTGNTPRDTVRSVAANGSGPTRKKALLTRALDALSRFDFKNESLPWALYTAMLEFVTSAQNNWSWAMGDPRQQNSKFIPHLLEFLEWLAQQTGDLRSEAVILKRSYHNKFASLVCEILAMCLHSSRQIGDVTALKDILPKLAYLQTHALDIPSYNVSLHSNLKQNLAKKFRGVSLENFKRTTLCPDSFGRSFFYDLSLADQLLGFDSTWSRPRQDQGFSAEVVRANLNLGFVESQAQILQSWKVLAVELSSVIEKDDRLPGILISVVRDCMTANAESTLPEALFGQLMTVRADLAFVLLQKMVISKVKDTNARRLLTPIWNAIRASTPDFDIVFSSEQVHYYRFLLRTLYLSLQFHLLDSSATTEDNTFRSTFRASLPAKSTELVEPISNQLLEVLSEIVAKGFRSLANQLHTEPESVSPSDFALLTAILQTILRIPEMINWHAQAALIFANSNTVRYATSLFSWSDRLTISNNGVDDPIYGELSLLFILSLSSMQPLAETMAVEGILSQLSTANLMKYYHRPGGMSPFDAPSRLFSIWTKGILPLCLNLLYAVGPPIAGEISAFLNQFHEQLLRASNALDDRRLNKLTLSITSEAHSLALIAAILENNRAQGPRLGIQASDIPVLDWDKENIKEDIESWMARKGALREKIVVVDESDAALFDKKLGDDTAETMLEERVLRELDAAGDCLGLGKSNGS
ncbi:hypothetical protein CC78DRAFT_519532 [Lojkania enalia]|uniref:Nucleoporin n=1 Tax=Lojkania enalia TaxID=147567 RepID=A0A9P4K723_9PLEO|nr:hypothetical protein CC78DRAFT_519532 [Didymosphaeria enalia]